VRVPVRSDGGGWERRRSGRQRHWDHGANAGNLTMTGSGNSAIGASALLANTNGSSNTSGGQDDRCPGAGEADGETGEAVGQLLCNAGTWRVSRGYGCRDASLKRGSPAARTVMQT